MGVLMALQLLQQPLLAKGGETQALPPCRGDQALLQIGLQGEGGEGSGGEGGGRRGHGGRRAQSPAWRSVGHSRKEEGLAKGGRLAERSVPPTATGQQWRIAVKKCKQQSIQP